MIYRIGKELIFPQPVDVEPDGLLCIGGDLSVDRLLLAYSHGIFPWFSFRDYDEPLWYCPQERFVIFPEEIHVSHSMRTLINKGKYDVSIGDDFDGVIRGCQKADGRYDSEGAWLSEDIIRAYTELHRQNLAQSVEVWEGRPTRGRTLRRYARTLLHRREHVLARAQCKQARAHLPRRVHAGERRTDD